MSPSSNLSVPRRELCSLVLGNKIGQELAEELSISRDKVYLHSDSLIAMYWLQKEPGKLNTYVSNRIQKIREGGFKVFYTKTDENPADFLTKIKPASSYLNNPLWEEGPNYMTQNDWRAGRSIDEIRQKLSPTTEQKQEIELEIKKKFQEINLNLAKTEEV